MTQATPGTSTTDSCHYPVCRSTRASTVTSSHGPNQKLQSWTNLNIYIRIRQIKRIAVLLNLPRHLGCSQQAAARRHFFRMWKFTSQNRSILAVMFWKKTCQWVIFSEFASWKYRSGATQAPSGRGRSAELVYINYKCLQQLWSCRSIYRFISNYNSICFMLENIQQSCQGISQIWLLNN